MNVSMYHLQIDNQLYMTPFPVMLVPKFNPEQPKFLDLSYRSSNVYETVTFVDGFLVNIQKVEVKFPRNFILSL